MIPGLKKRISVSRALVHDRLKPNTPTPPSKTLQLRSVFLCVVLVILALAFSCSRQPENGEQPVNRSTIKIGYFGDLSGPNYNFSQSAMNGVLMAAAKMNQYGGIKGRQIDVVIEDDRGSPEESARLTAKLIDRDKVIAIVAGGVSGNSLAAAPKAQSSHVPLISPSSTDPAVTKTGDYIFRTCFVDSFQGEVMASFAAATLQAKKAAILFDFNSPYGRGLTDFFEASFRKLGGEIVNKQSYKQGDTDFKGQLSSIEAAEPDVIYIPGYYGDVALIAKQARALGLEQPLLGGDGWDAPELWQLGGDALNGSYMSTHYSPDSPSPEIQSFVEEYKQRYQNLSPDAHAALAYDATRLLFDALERAGTTDSGPLRDALAQTKDFKGVTGLISIDADRNAVKPAIVLKLQDADFIYQETIQPKTSEPQPTPQSPSPARSRRSGFSN
ncbi:MAG: ABC transporter substrate-binding protein [Acidobacteria bacterium]|nr:ABC transporter substrate-binding protein [Acidobacteriota bacterium]